MTERRWRGPQVRRRTPRREAALRAGRWARRRVLPGVGSVAGAVLAAAGAFTLGLTIGLFVSATLVWLLEWRFTE